MAASQARLLMLTARKSDLELQLQYITQVRIQIQNALRTANAQQRQALVEADKKLELQMKRIDVQHKAVQTEIETVQKILQKNIETSFKIHG